MFCKKAVLKNFAKVKEKHLCQSLFFKKETLAQVFSCENCEDFKKSLFWRTSANGCFYSLTRDFGQSLFKQFTVLHLLDFVRIINQFYAPLSHISCNNFSRIFIGSSLFSSPVINRCVFINRWFLLTNRFYVVDGSNFIYHNFSSYW